MHKKLVDAWDDNKGKAYSITLQHCHPETLKKLKTFKTYKLVSDSSDMMRLVKLIRGLAHKHDETQQGTMSIVDHDLRLYTG